MENHHLSWENSLYMVIFHSYVSHYQSVLHRFMALQLFIVDRVLFGIVLLFIVMESTKVLRFPVLQAIL